MTITAEDVRAIKAMLPARTVTVRDWQSDAAHLSKPVGAHLRVQGSTSLWNCPAGITVTIPATGQRTVSWAVGMILSCQTARGTEAE